MRQPRRAPELVADSMLLLVAGNETTTKLIGNAVLALLAHPDPLERGPLSLPLAF